MQPVFDFGPIAGQLPVEIKKCPLSNIAVTKTSANGINLMKN